MKFRNWIPGGERISRLFGKWGSGGARGESVPVGGFGGSLVEEAFSALRISSSSADAWKITPRVLSELSAELVDQNVRTEPDFVSLGKDLRNLYSNASQLSKMVSDGVSEVRSSLDVSKIAGQDGIAGRSLKDLLLGLEETSDGLQTLRQVTRELGRLGGRVRDIDRIAVFLKSSVFNFAIESARSPQCQAAFGSFAEEMRQLGDKIAGLAEKIGTQTRSTHRTQNEVVDVISSNLQQLHELAKKVESASHSTSSEVEELLHSSFASLQEAERNSQQIARFANDAVFQLQFGDIVRQKCEHILEALQTAQDVLSKVRSKEELQDAAAKVDLTLAVQAGQLELIRKEIETARRKLGECFSGIGRETMQLNRVIQALQGPSSAQENGEGPFDALKADLLRLAELQERGMSSRNQARETSRHASELVKQLSTNLEQVKLINREIHLQALNAIIKTASLGDQGVTLEVLSMQVDRLFRESNQGVTEIMDILQSIVACADAGKIDVESEFSQESSLRGSLLIGLDNVERAFQNLGTTSLSASALVQKQQASLEKSQAGLVFLEGLARKISRYERELSRLRMILGRSKSRSSAGQTEDFSARYTMESERRIHAQVRNGNAANGTGNPFGSSTRPGAFGDSGGSRAMLEAQPQRPPARPAADEEELGGNVELF
jgi:hypothetical protein